MKQKIGLMLHLYQPVTQDRKVFGNIFESSYSPLLKFIKSSKDFKVTLNTPLSLLRQMEEYGYQDWIDLLRSLVDAEKIEIVGSAAYHPLLARVPTSLVEKQIILNEYSLGYYLGRKMGFEGEPSIMMRNLNGFFPPELNVNMELLHILNSLEYSWMIADESAIGGGAPGVYSVKDFNTKLVVRNTKLSNLISFKRDTEIDDIMSEIEGLEHVIVALDGEVFGHHYSEGFHLLDLLVADLHKKHFEFITLSEMVDDVVPVEIDSFSESTWSSTLEDVDNGNVYPIWDIRGNEIQQKLWVVFNKVCNHYADSDTYSNITDFETLPIWVPTALKGIEDSLRLKLEEEIVVLKSLQSDQFWWASNIEMAGKILYSTHMIKQALALYTEVANISSDEDFRKDIVNDIQSVIDSVNRQDEVLY